MYISVAELYTIRGYPPKTLDVATLFGAQRLRQLVFTLVWIGPIRLFIYVFHLTVIPANIMLLQIFLSESRATHMHDLRSSFSLTGTRSKGLL